MLWLTDPPFLALLTNVAINILTRGFAAHTYAFDSRTAGQRVC